MARSSPAPRIVGIIQIRIHGRGGQGVVTAAELLSVAAFIDHLWIRVRDPQASRRFYTTIAPHAGLHLAHDAPGRMQLSGPDYSFSLVRDERPLTEHVHLAFPASEDSTVRAFHAAALAAGYEDHGAPGERASTTPATTARSCSTPTGTTSRSSTTPGAEPWPSPRGDRRNGRTSAIRSRRAHYRSARTRAARRRDPTVATRQEAEVAECPTCTRRLNMADAGVALPARPSTARPRRIAKGMSVATPAPSLRSTSGGPARSPADACLA